MDRVMVSGEIMLLVQISCYVYFEDVTILNGSPFAKQAIDRLLKDELITYTRHDQTLNGKHVCPYDITNRGDALIEKWGNTPLPVLEEKWV